MQRDSSTMGRHTGNLFWAAEGRYLQLTTIFDDFSPADIDLRPNAGIQKFECLR